ncbi:MAG: pilin [bacterium]|nr:pilin [bacterium]
MKSFATYCLILVALVLIPVSVPVLTKAETEYTLLQPLPLYGLDTVDQEKTTAEQYIEGIVTLTIAIAGGLAVIMIIYGGIKYMSSDAIGGKGEAKDIIQNAIWGLLLTISAWLILYTINPDLIEFNLDLPTPDKINNP